MSLISKRAGAAAPRRALQLPPRLSGRLQRYSPEWRDSDPYRLLSEVMGEAERQVLAATAAVVADRTLGDPHKGCARYEARIDAADDRMKPVRRKTPFFSGSVRLLGRTVPVIRTLDGIRALEKDLRPASAASVERYLASKFGDHLDGVRTAMEQSVASLLPEELNRRGFALYEAFRPAIPAGARGWGAAGELNLNQIIGLAGGEP